MNTKTDPVKAAAAVLEADPDRSLAAETAAAAAHRAPDFERASTGGRRFWDPGDRAEISLHRAGLAEAEL